jgi:hypothetical protein
MSNIDRLKSMLASVEGTSSVRVSLGTDGQPTAQQMQITAAELMTALGMKTNKPTRRVTIASTATPSLRVRKQPTTSSIIVANLVPGLVVEVYDQAVVVADGIRWLQLADGRGWIAEQYTIPVDETAKPTWTLPFTAAQRGVHASAGGWSPAPQDKQLDLVRSNKIEVALIVTYEPAQAQQTLSRFRGAGIKQFIFRAASHQMPTSNPGAFVEKTKAVLSEYASVLGSTRNMMIAVHNEPNLIPEGWVTAWHNGAEFAAWFKAVAAAYRTLFAGAKIGFPALSPGGSVTNLRTDEAQFIREAASAINDADWIGVHYYWQKPDGSDIAPPINNWKTWFGTKPLVATEVGPTDQNVITAPAMKLAYQRFAAINVPAIGYILNGAGGWENAAWDIHNIVF